MIPVQIKVVDKKYLFVKWNDESETQIKLANLRRDCPCAVCATERTERGEKYIPIYSDLQLTIKNIHTVGSYAIGIVWSDDHNTGIYDFDYLKKISNT
ncbi:MAG: DUF971 domain-containing protein [Bacteroidota bacterium]